MLGTEKGNVARDEVYPHDDVSQPPIPSSDSKFLPTLGQVGEEIVARYDREPVLAAFHAWLAEFVPKFDVLDGTDGGEWSLLKELTWPLFLQVVRSMRKGKAVGAGGFSIELLSGASDEVLRSLYEALICDVRSGVVSSDWKRVLYVLLPKPGNDLREVGQCREIALMAQEMKLLLQMVRRACYCRVARRVLHHQVGWVSGHGAFDPAVTAAMMMQQARALQQDIYVLYIDLSSFFSIIHRGVLEACELWHGVPDDVVDLALLIYGAADDPEHAVDCQFDSAAGLSRPFKNPRGALMGDVLSPDKAKILLNSIVAAIDLHVRGVRLWGWGEEQRAETWKHIAQLCYADDWCGIFRSAAEARAAWSI